MIVENKHLNENYFLEVMPSYVKVDETLGSGNLGCYFERVDFIKSEGDERIKKKFNHIIKGIVMKSEGQYYDEEEISKKFDIYVRDKTTNKNHWCWCGIEPGTEAFKNFIPGDDNTHFTVYFEISVNKKT